MKNYIQKVAWALVLLLAATLSLSAKDGTAVRKLFKKGVSDSISVGGSKLVVLQKDLIRNRSLSVNSIGEENVPELDFAMTNVTAGGHGYRFLPHGTHFTGEGATVKIKYDRTRIPSGYTEDDIRTYYYDPAEKHWVALERVRVDKKEECVVSKTTHFTDMINGVIQAPESPQTEGFAPTMMNDIKAADPTAKLNVIAPPSANNRGSANLQYPFEMPPARNGMQPSLGLQYSSEGGSGWLGEGWNVSVPSITLDTRWGVPRYDQSKETETYLLSGSMLSTMDDNGQMGVAHRGEKMNRKADRQFYTRQGGDFSRIIRKGDSPANYYWEVTDKQGVKYIYGGDGAVVKGNVTDASGSTREVIAEWKLKRVEELHGDYIEYVYDIVDEDVRGGLKAKAAYLKEVHAGNAGQEPHTVVLFDGNKVKQVKTNNARYGFLASSNKLLEKVTVNFQGETLRSYAFDYKEGAFHKEMLTGVRQYDNTGKEVAFQNFDYYDDVQAEKGYVPFKDDSEKWNTHDDGLDAGFVNPLKTVSKRFSDKPTALGGTTSSSVSGSFYAGVGPWDGSKWKGNTIGGSYSYSSDTSKGLSALVDLNGDGLPDKVYKSGGSVYYRPQIKTDNGEVVYGEPVKVKGISNLKEVHAGNAGQEPHTVVLFDGNKVKQVKTNNARYGFLASSNKLLEKVTVNFQGETLRSYAFDYKEGAFHKEMLTGVRQYDNTGKEVAFQNFDYYDDVQAEKGYVPFKDDSEKWNTHDDGLDAGFVNPLKTVSKRFSDKPTALGGTTSSSVSGSFYAGVGPWDGSKWKGNTIGGSYSYSSDTSKGLSALVDLNGDGLPDKVYKSGGSVYYRPQIKTDNGEVVYGEPVKVKGISNFSTTKSSTNSFGAKAVVGWNVLTAVVGTDKSTTKTKTSQYFSDINGDGLVDLVSNGKVYFNHLEFDQSGNAVPTFTLSSADTPSPIIYGGKVDTSVMEVSKDEQAEAIKNSPMEDIVRVWQAPKDGTVSVTGQVSLIAPTDDYDADEYQKADGVRIAIQKGGNELWNKTIAKGDNSPYSAAVSSVAVKRGDRIYFRVQSGSEETSNGSFDKVNWSPTITYAGESNTLPNGLSSTEYKPEDGAIYDVNTSANVENGSSVEVHSAFHKPVTTDDVVLSIIGSNEKKDSDGNDNPNYIEKTVFARTLKANETFNGDSLNISLENTEKLTNFSFEISSTSNVDWKNIGWQASVTYKDSANIEQTVAVPAHYNTFANALAEGKPYLTTATDTIMVVSPVLTLSDNSINGQITLTAKTEDALIGKKSFNIENGILKADTLRFATTAGKNIWFEYSYPAAISNETVTSASVSILKDAAGLVTENVLAGFYAENDNLGFGMLYRGWGGFVYNSAEGRYAKPIDESLLKLPENENDKVDPLTMAFTPLGTDQTSMDKWVGQRQDIYLTATEASTARLTEQDVLLTNPLDNNAEVAGLAGEYLQGTGAAAVSQVVSSKSTVVQGGALGITHNNANGSSKTDCIWLTCLRQI